MSSSPNTVLEVPCNSRRVGEQNIQLNMLREGPINYALTPEKIRDLWVEASKHDVLFSDYTAGKLEPFMDVLLDPRGIWMEMTADDEIIGAIYLSDVIPGFDAFGHFTFWDSIASGREPIALFAAEYLMDRYNLHRMSAKVPVYQKGTIRFTERLGFVREGKIREAVPHKGQWIDMYIYGLLRSELDDQMERIW